MDKSTIQTLIDKVIGKKGLIRVPSWWMRKVLMQMADWVQEGDDANGKKIREYPIHDKSHVEAAVRMFPNAPLKYRKSLAERILRKAREFNMDTSNWKSLNGYKGSD